jgi:hypothetical protein
VIRFLCPLALLLALTAAGDAAPAEKAADKKPPPIETTSAVYSRLKGEAEWSLFGYYSAEPAARRVFEHLARSGYEVELRISNLPIPKVAARSPTGILPFKETVSEKKAMDVFKWMTRQKDIAFRFPTDGCYARCQLMIERMQKNGFKPRKIWAVANGDELYARTKNHPDGHVTWGYHVAPVLRVRVGDDKQRWYVIDPALGTAPMTISEWEAAQMRTPRSHKPYLTITKVGDAPLWVDKKRKPGSGYWPGNDPKIGLHEHAVATMKKYKPWEGKKPPKNIVWAPGCSNPFPGRDPSPQSPPRHGEGEAAFVLHPSLRFGEGGWGEGLLPAGEGLSTTPRGWSGPSRRTSPASPSAAPGPP